MRRKGRGVVLFTKREKEEGPGKGAEKESPCEKSFQGEGEEDEDAQRQWQWRLFCYGRVGVCVSNNANEEQNTLSASGK